jgi:hypothetical protein
MFRTINLLAPLALALGAVPAAAEQHMSGEDYQTLQDFVAPIQEQAAQAVEAGDWDGIAGWMAEHTMPEAPFYFDGDLVLSSGPVIGFQMTLSGADLTDYARAAGGMHMSGMDAIEDYELTVDVKAAWQVPGEAVAGEVAFYESGRIEVPEGSAMPSGPFSSATVCAIRLSGGEIRTIELANCKVNANL